MHESNVKNDSTEFDKDKSSEAHCHYTCTVTSTFSFLYKLIISIDCNISSLLLLITHSLLLSVLSSFYEYKFCLYLNSCDTIKFCFFYNRKELVVMHFNKVAVG